MRLLLKVYFHEISATQDKDDSSVRCLFEYQNIIKFHTVGKGRCFFKVVETDSVFNRGLSPTQ